MTYTQAQIDKANAVETAHRATMILPLCGTFSTNGW